MSLSSLEPPKNTYMVYCDQVSGKTPKYTDATDRVIYKQYSARQHFFYEYLSTVPIYSLDRELKKYVPVYLGCENLLAGNIQSETGRDSMPGHSSRKQWVSHICSRLQTDQHSPKYLMLCNLTQRYKMPCIVDIKLGKKLDFDERDPEHYQKYRLSTTQSHHFRINGMKTIHVNEHNQFVRELFINKYYFQNATPAQVQNYLALMFYDGLRIDQQLLSYCIGTLKAIVMAVQGFKAGHFHSSSLLICYDGLDHRKRNIKLIDFDQYEPSLEPVTNMNVLQGLKNILTYFDNIRDSIPAYNRTLNSQQVVSFAHQHAIPSSSIQKHTKRRIDRQKQG